jgi:VCBS repeat-containing protein
MKVNVFPKIKNGNPQSFDRTHIPIETPSVVTLATGPEQVARFERAGSDLVLVFKDGTRLVIENFFIETADGRNDLVFEDSHGVTWWAQYDQEWTGFDIAEINEDLAAAVLPHELWAGLGALVGAGGLASVAGGSSEATQNKAPVAEADPITTPEDTPVRGRVTGEDPDSDELSFALEDGPTHGSVTVNEDGTYTYTPDANYNGSDSFTVTVSDGNGGTDIVTVDVTVSPVNDLAVVANDSGAVTEDADAGAGKLTTSGKLYIADDDPDESRFDTETLTPKGTPLGTLTIGAKGNWTYEVDNSLTEVQRLAAGETLIETWEVTSADGTATGTIEVTITGTNEVPEITNASGAVTEDIDVVENKLTTSGKLDISDNDPDESRFDTETLTPKGTPLGTLTIGADGNWTYEVDNSLAEIQSLAAGETLTETWEVTSADGTATGTITVAINGTNDAPVILSEGSGLAASITEITDGAAGENSITHSQTGTIKISEPDKGDTLSVSAADLGSGYIGTFTPKVSPATGDVDWTFSVDDAELDAMAADDRLIQHYQVTVKDSAGKTDTVPVTVTITGSDDAPETGADTSLITAGQDAVLDILANDRDAEGDTLTLTEVDGQTILAGGNITLSDDRGTVSLGTDGKTLTFTPGPNAPDTLELPYTVEDFSGPANSTGTGLWTINIADVAISDNDGPNGTPDEVLTSADDLEHVDIGGHAAPEGSVTSLTISDGINSVSVPTEAIAVNADGTYSTRADLRGLDDGELTVTAMIKDAAGNTVTTTDTIAKETVTEVAIAPVLIEKDVPPTISGTGEPQARITLTVGGETHTDIEVDDDGNWSVTLNAPLDNSDVTISAKATDIYGNTAEATRDVGRITAADAVEDEPENIRVSEAGLSDGSDPSGGAGATSSTIILGATPDTLKHVVIGGETIPLPQLQDAADTPVNVATSYGTLTITGYDTNTGAISYTYTLNDNTTHNKTPETDSILRETIQIAAVEVDGDTRITTLVVGVADDAPLTPDDDTLVSVAEGGDMAVGSNNGGANLLTNDTLGADGGRVHQITYTDDLGDSVTITIPEDGSQTVDTQFGALTVHSNGTWSYTPDDRIDHEKPDNDTALHDDFSYTVIDADGDISTRSATQEIAVTDTMAVLGDPIDTSVAEANLASGTDPDTEATTVDGSLNLTVAQDSVNVTLDLTAVPKNLKSGGKDVEYALSTDGHTLTAHTGDASDPVFIVALTDPTSKDAGYEFTLHRALNHTDSTNMDLAFGVQVTDDDGDTDGDTFTVTVVDDAPATEVNQTISEDGSFSYQISADATAATTGITQGGELTGTTKSDGSVEYTTQHGTVTISATGKLTYKPADNFSGTEVFQVATPDDAGGSDLTTDVTIEVTPMADAPEVTVDAAQINTQEDTKVALGLKAPAITDNGSGTGNNTTPERIGAITLSDLPAGATLDWGGGTHVVNSSGQVTIKLTDVATETDTTANLSMTRAQFESLEIQPPTDSSENFIVQYSVTSYEVDASGKALSDVDGETSSTSVAVYVQAVTDDAALAFDTDVDASEVENADAITYNGTGEADVTMNEDATVNIAGMLSASFGEPDGSEVQSFTIANGTGHTIVVNGTEIANGGTLDVPAADLDDDGTVVPDITLSGTGDFSGELNGITVTLNALDKDADGYLGVSGPADGIAEDDTTNNSVTLNLHVNPVADDVNVEAVTTNEDSAINFLAGVSVSDKSTSTTTGGSEVITDISFEVPTDWVVTAPPVWAEATAGLSGTTYTISFSGGTQTARETYLDDFTIAPPAHYGGKVTIPLTIKTVDASKVNGGEVEDAPAASVHDLVVTANPKAEKVGNDTDSNDTDDLTMTPGKAYTSAGAEDAWFNLNSDGFILSDGWSNEDTSEETFARLTPVLEYGDGSAIDAAGSTFRWEKDGTIVEEIFDGSTPIDVPVDSLDTLKFKAAADFSGQFRIEVTAYTVDRGEVGTSKDAAESGGALLENILIAPEADDVTVALTARAHGLEDEEINLSIRPTSSDPSETFTITIEDIPEGSVLTYDGSTLTVTDGSVTIKKFDPSAPLILQPPANSNTDFTLKVRAVSVDTLEVDGTTYSSTSDETVLTMDIDMRGVADAADVTVAPQTYEEAELDDGSASILLNDLVTVALQDNDGSETLTVQISGLPDGFAPTQGTLLTAPSATGEARMWVIDAGQLATTGITVPENFRGKVAFSVAPVTTENDGASLTGDSMEVSFKVTPSPEATVTTEAELIEDAEQAIDLSIVHQNGDTDEVLEAVAIKQADVAGANFTLYVDGVEISAAGLPTITEGGVDYYKLTAAHAGQLTAQGAPHLDGDLGGFDLLYKVTDPGDGTVANVTSDWIAGHFDLRATPLTDQPALTIKDITLASSDGTVSGSDVTMTTAGEQVTVNLNVATPDSDGSEHLIRVILNNVPEGVTVQGGEMLGGGQWMLVYAGDDARPVDDTNGIVVPVTFTAVAGGLTDVPINVTVQTQDRGNEAGAETDVEEASITWNLTTDFEPGTPSDPPAIIIWEYTDASAIEDTGFQLSEMIEAEVSVPTDTSASILTVTLADLPEDTQITGMTRSVVNEQEVWTASIVTEATDDETTVNAKLDALLDSITVQAAENANDNNADDFAFSATLTSAAIGGESEVATITPVIPVDPVTDEADVSITLGAADADGRLTESDTTIPLTITVSNAADGNAGLITSDLYLQISGTNGLGNGVLRLGGDTYTPQTVSGIDGITDGTYYLIPNVKMGDTLDLTFTPATMVAGEVTVDARVRNVETGANSVTSSGTQTLPVEISNNGVTFTATEARGTEAANSTNASLIEIDLSSLALEDNDGSEDILTVLLSNLPEGFLVFTGPTEADASVASMTINAGGTGGMNTWVLTNGGADLPAYVGILPPKHWSGTLDDLSLIVTSGETTLSETRVDTLELDDVTVMPVANGITLDPTNSFGTEGTIIPLNLNAAMVDSEEAVVVAAPDESVETTTLQVQGLGAHAAFYIGAELVTSHVSYDAGKDTYTLTGLSQSALDNLGFVQAKAAVTDQATATSGVQVKVTAYTMDGTEMSTSTSDTVTLNLSTQLSTSGNDDLIWTGEALDGRGGADTVNLRLGENLTGDELAAKLANIETLDLGIDGVNGITDLSPENVEAITDNTNALTITKTTADSLSLSGGWTDNGDGSFTGTVSGEDVTLTVEDGPMPETITSLGFTTKSLFSAGAEDSFGLATLETGEEPESKTAESEPLGFDDLMSSETEGEDLTAALPEESAGGGKQPEPTSSNDTAQPLTGTALEDDLQATVFYEV